MTSNLKSVELFLQLLRKKVKSDKKNLTLEANDSIKLYELGSIISSNLIYRDKQLFIDLVSDFINEPILDKDDWFSGQFRGLYATLDKQVYALSEQTLMVNNEKAFVKCKKLLKLEMKNVSIFCDAVENLWFYCDFYNPKLSEKDDLYYSYEQLKQACERFLDKVRQL